MCRFALFRNTEIAVHFNYNKKKNQEYKILCRDNAVSKCLYCYIKTQQIAYFVLARSFVYTLKQLRTTMTKRKQPTPCVCFDVTDADPALAIDLKKRRLETADQMAAQQQMDETRPTPEVRRISFSHILLFFATDPL